MEKLGVCTETILTQICSHFSKSSNTFYTWQPSSCPTQMTSNDGRSPFSPRIMTGLFLLAARGRCTHSVLQLDVSLPG